jgi:hypothetical protein
MSLPGFSNLKELRHLSLYRVGLTDIQGLDLLNKLETLYIYDCSNLIAIPDLSNMGWTLRYLDIHGCYDLEFVPSLSNLFSLQYLDISNRKQIEEIHGVEDLQNLKRLRCEGSSIRFLPDLSILSNLGVIGVSGTHIQQTGGEGEVSYRERIVRAICDMVSPVTEFDVSDVEGTDRICTFFREVRIVGGDAVPYLCGSFVILN